MDVVSTLIPVGVAVACAVMALIDHYPRSKERSH